MLTINHIQASIKTELTLFEKKFKASMKSDAPMVDKIMRYIIKRKGKQIRPTLVLLTAKIFGEIKEETYRAAAMIELLHTATLVHDDVIDEANFRRGFFSINALWKNKIAVLIGDFLLSKGLLLSVNHNDFKLLKIVSGAVKEMSEGELLQIEKARRLDIKEDVYFKIIKKKTAALMAACCASGANSISQNSSIVKQMYLFGEKMGIAFQIKDDLLDYVPSTITGKPKGLDIRGKKMTLPLIYTLTVVSTSIKKNIINTIKNHNDDEQKIAKVIQLIQKNGGIDYAKSKMKQYNFEALSILNNFPNNKASKSLKLLLKHIISRKK